ncbi:MAG: hypothetical protein WC441_03665 [Patescibacteria group bacterium]
MSTLYSVGAMNQLGDALEKAGFTPDEVTKLKQFAELGKIRDLLAGLATISYPEHLIDCDAAPFVPDGLSVEEHKKSGLLKFVPTRAALYLSKRQKTGYICGHDLRKELAAKPVMNANVLDYLFAHPELIPESWKGKAIFFWGTIYRDPNGALYVRCLGWRGSEWSRFYFLLGGDFSSGHPAALAS